MKIGDLRKQISVQAEQQTADAAGGYALAWVTLATVWADIAPVSGSESYGSGHLESHVTHKITARWRSDLALTADMRILYGTRSFNIRAILNKDEDNQWAEFLVEEGGAV